MTRFHRAFGLSLPCEDHHQIHARCCNGLSSTQQSSAFISTHLKSKDSTRYQAMILIAMNSLDWGSKVRFFYRKPHTVLSLQWNFTLKYKHFLIPKRQYFLFSVFPGKGIFVSFSQSPDAVKPVGLIKQMMWGPPSPQITTENQQPCSKQVKPKAKRFPWSVISGGMLKCILQESLCSHLPPVWFCEKQTASLPSLGSLVETGRC